MELFFGEFTKQEQKEMGDYVDTSTLFKNKNKMYWYKAVIDRELGQVCLYDTCDRHFPIGLEHVAETDLIMLAARKFYEIQTETEKLEAKKLNEINQILDHFSK